MALVYIMEFVLSALFILFIVTRFMPREVEELEQAKVEVEDAKLKVEVGVTKKVAKEIRKEADKYKETE